MTHSEKLHQAYHIHTTDHHDRRAEELYGEVELSKLREAKDLQVYGFMALEFGEIHQAIKALKQSAQKDSKDAQTYLLLGITHRRLKEYVPAITAFRKSLKIQPKNIDAIYNLGITLDDAQSYEPAIDVLEKGLEITPKDTDLLNAIAGASASAGYTEDAIEYYREAIDLEPNFAPFEYNLSQVFLQTEQWEEGWKLFDSRLAFRNKSLNPKTEAPFWKGENLEDKSILVWNEQGFGDTLQFARYVLPLKEKGARVYLRVQTALKRLFEDVSSKAPIEVLTSDEEVPKEVNFQIPIMSLPQYFGNTPIPLQTPIYHNVSIQSSLQKQAPKIALVWAGNPHHPDDQKRSIPARFFARLLKIKDIEWYSLQYGKAHEDLLKPNITALASAIEDFKDTAEHILKMDLVISVDTAVAHLAGSMNKKVWLLLDYAPDWRWGLDSVDTIWYPSMRIFRQQKVGNWNEVMNRVLKELKSQK